MSIHRTLLAEVMVRKVIWPALQLREKVERLPRPRKLTRAPTTLDFQRVVLPTRTENLVGVVTIIAALEEEAGSVRVQVGGRGSIDEGGVVQALVAVLAVLEAAIAIAVIAATADDAAKVGAGKEVAVASMTTMIAGGVPAMAITFDIIIHRSPIQSGHQCQHLHQHLTTPIHP